MTINTWKKEFTAWKDSNPIRKRRTEKGLVMSEVAAICGLSTSAVQFWETGAYEPRDANWDALEKLLGGGLREEWQEWFAAKPKI